MEGERGGEHAWHTLRTFPSLAAVCPRCPPPPCGNLLLTLELMCVSPPFLCLTRPCVCCTFQSVYPYLGKDPALTIPPECPLHPALDMFKDQVHAIMHIFVFTPRF